jgi:transposase
MSIKPRASFSSDFKREAVQLLDRGDKSGAQLARELGIRRNQLYKWKAEIDDHGEKAFPGHGRRPSSNDEMALLKKEIKRLKAENEILKKADTYFAQRRK